MPPWPATGTYGADSCRHGWEASFFYCCLQSSSFCGLIFARSRFHSCSAVTMNGGFSYCTNTLLTRKHKPKTKSRHDHGVRMNAPIRLKCGLHASTTIVPGLVAGASDPCQGCSISSRGRTEVKPPLANVETAESVGIVAHGSTSGDQDCPLEILLVRCT